MQGARVTTLKLARFTTWCNYRDQDRLGQGRVPREFGLNLKRIGKQEEKFVHTDTDVGNAHLRACIFARIIFRTRECAKRGSKTIKQCE